MNKGGYSTLDQDGSKTALNDAPAQHTANGAPKTPPPLPPKRTTSVPPKAVSPRASSGTGTPQNLFAERKAQRVTTTSAATMTTPLRDSVSSPRDSSESNDLSSSKKWLASPRTQRPGTIQSINTQPVVATIPAAPLSVPQKLEPEFDIHFDPLAHVKATDELLKERLKRLGSQSAPEVQALGEIKAIFAEQYFRTSTAPDILRLKALLPNAHPKTKDPTSPKPISSLESTGIPSEDDTQSSSKPASDEAQAASSGNTSTPSSSPDHKTTARPNPVQGASADSDPVERVADNKLEVPHDSGDSLESQEAAESIPTLLPLCDLFSRDTIQAIIADNNLRNDDQLLKPLHTLIAEIHDVLKKLKETNRLRLHAPLEILFNYYKEQRDKLINAPNAKERKNLLQAFSYAVGDLCDHLILQSDRCANSAETGLLLACRDPLGVTQKKNDTGMRAGGIHCALPNGSEGVYIKPNPPGGNFLCPATERAVRAWYQLFCQDRIVSAPSAIIKVSHVQIDPVAALDPKLARMIKYYGENPYLEFVAQCGHAIEGPDLNIACDAIGLLTTWINTRKESDLLEDLKTLETMSAEDRGHYEKWPERLTAHIDRDKLKAKPNENEKQQKDRLDRIDDVNKRLRNCFKSFHELIPDYTPEKGIRDIPNILNQMDHYSFCAFFFANLAIDPTDLKADNLKLTWVNNADGTRTYYIVGIDVDQAMEFPIAYNKSNDTHQPTIKCIPFLMKHLLQRGIDPRFYKEFLSRSPHAWVADWCQLLNEDDQRYRTLQEKQCITPEDVTANPRTDSLDQPAAPVDEAHPVAPTAAPEVEQPLDIPLKLHPERSISIHKTLERLFAEMKKNPKITLQECLRITRPETALYYEHVCYPELDDNNIAGTLTTAYNKVHNWAITFEAFFLGDAVKELIRQHPTTTTAVDTMDGIAALMRYKKLLASDNADGKLPSLSDLAKDCRFNKEFKRDKHGEFTLFDVLEEHTQPAGKHAKGATLTIKRATKLFVAHLPFWQYVAQNNPDLLRTLDQIGTQFSFITIPRFTETKNPNNSVALSREDYERDQRVEQDAEALVRDDLLLRAAAAGMGGAIKLLTKKGKESHFRVANINTRTPSGETPLHVLMQAHATLPAKQALSTLEACLNAAGCDPRLLDQHNRTPLMVLIDCADNKEPKLTQPFIKALRLRKVNLDQRTAFACPQAQKLALFASTQSKRDTFKGTALDYAIRCNNPAALIALLNEGATHLSDTVAAIKFALHYQSHNDMQNAITLLEKRNPKFAYEYAIERMSTSKPDKDHPSECMLEGAQNKKRYFHKDIWAQLVNPKGELNIKKSVAAGTHTVIPLEYERKVLTYCKAIPEFPGRQYALDTLHRLFGSIASLHTELWRIVIPKDKTVLPLQMSNAVTGIPLTSILREDGALRALLSTNDPQYLPLRQMVEELLGTDFDIKKYDHAAVRKKLLSTMDPYYLALLVFIENLVGQEDGHDAQFILVPIPTPEGLRTVCVNVDGDHAFVPAFVPDGKGGKKIFIKDILFLLKEVYGDSLDAQAVEMLTQMNATQLFDELNRLLDENETHQLNLFPRDEEDSYTLTAMEAAKRDNYIRTLVRNRTTDQAENQKTKTLTVAEKNQTLSFLGKKLQASKERVQKALKIDHDFTHLGVCFEENELAKLFERFSHCQKVLQNKARGGFFSGLMLMQHTRPALFREYFKVINENPGLDPFALFEILTKGLFKHIAGKQGLVTGSTPDDILVSQLASDKHQATGKFSTIKAAIQIYERCKTMETEKEKAIATISRGDTTPLQAFPLDSQKEYIINRLRWDSDLLDNSAIIETIIEQQISFTELKLKGCTAITLGQLKRLLENSPNLETLDLTGCTGLNGDVLELLSRHCPDVQTVKLSKTNCTSVDATYLPALTTLELAGCGALKSVRLNAPKLQHLILADAIQIRELSLSDNTRALQYLNISDCRALPTNDINAVINASPALTKLHHKNNEPFFARPFIWYALKNNNVTDDTLEALVQDGKLHLYGLEFEDHHLEQLTQWLRPSKNPALLGAMNPAAQKAPTRITEVNFLGCCLLSRAAQLKFINDNKIRGRLIMQGPLRTERALVYPPNYTLDMGLTGSITHWATLPNGALIAFEARQPKNARNPSRVKYSIRMPEHSNPCANFDPKKDIFKGSIHKLMRGADIRSIDVMYDGNILLSMVNGAGRDSIEMLVILDPITHKTTPIDVPEASSLAGKVCVLDSKTFALHSDQLYIITKEGDYWHVSYRAPSPVGETPIIKGPDGLLAYCFGEGEQRTLSVMDSETGQTLLTKTLATKWLKPLLFLDKERLIYFDGKAFLILNIKTWASKVIRDPIKEEMYGLEKLYDNEEQFNKLLEDILPQRIYAALMPSNEILIACDTSLLLDRETFKCYSESDTGDVIEKPLLCYQGDLVMHRADIMKDKNKPVLQIKRQKHFILDLSCLRAVKNGYQIESIRKEEGNFTLRIVAPENITTPADHIDNENEGYKIWPEKMFRNQPTCNTFYEMMSAFFEKTPAVMKVDRAKQQVQEHDNVIIISLAAAEARLIRPLLESLLGIPPSLLKNAERHRFNHANAIPQPPLEKRHSVHAFQEEEEESENSVEVLNQ